MKQHNIYTIQLFDAITGIMHTEVKADNIVTNAYQTIKNQAMQDDIIVASFDGVKSQTTNFKPVDAFGGVLLLNELQTDNVNNFIPQGEVVGYSGDSTSSSDPRRGQRNDGESGAIGSPTVTGFRYVDDFATDEANGTINSIALCSVDGGNGHLFTTFGLEQNGFSNLNNEYNQAYNDDKSILIQAENGTGNKREVPTTDGQYRFEQALYDGQYENTALTLTGYRSDRGVTFYDGSFYVLAHHIASGEDRIVKLDEDYTILTETDITISLTETNFWSYSCGILDDGTNLNAVFISSIDTGADTVTFKVLNLTSGIITDTIVTDNMTISTIDASAKTVYNTYRDPNGNENLISILNQGIAASAKYLVMFDNGKQVIEENICSFSGFVDGVTTAVTIQTPIGGYENLIRLGMDKQFTNDGVEQMRYDRAMMTNNDLGAPVVKTSNDTMKVTIDVNYV